MRVKVLWLTNGILPRAANSLKIVSGVNEGWLVGLSERILKDDTLRLSVCFPQTITPKLIQGHDDNLEYYGYPQLKAKKEYDSRLKDYFKEILSDSSPDVIHLMGSEYPHCYSMMAALNELGMTGKAVISIQGLVSVYADHIMQGIPFKYLKGRTLRDRVRKDTLWDLKKEFEYRGNYEKKAFQLCNNIIGRTDWDRACAVNLNPNAKYFFNNETLRPSFYDSVWNIEKCERHTIFISQATYSVKGFHFFLRALKLVEKRFPDVKVFVSGYGRYDQALTKPFSLLPQYQRYIVDLIKGYNLENRIVYCGVLNEQEIKKRYLSSNVFVSPSTIENSPNSVGEAMLLGVPVISSYVGGVANMLEDKKEGFFYQVDAPYMLADYICRIFENDTLAKSLSANARLHAQITHEPDKNYIQLLNIYKSIAECCELGSDT